MRYFQIRITDADTGNVLVPNYNGQPGFTPLEFSPGLWTYSSLNAGASPTTPGGVNPAAQRLELDVPVGYGHLPLANSYFKIYGVGLAEIAQAANLNGLNCAIYAGMSKGLPLANPTQAGLLTSGTILQSLGNWIGVEQSLSCYLMVAGSSPSSAQTTGNPATSTTLPVPATNAQPANIIFVWEPGENLVDAVVRALQVAYPQYSITGAISQNLVKSGATASGFYSNFQQFCTDIWQKSVSLISGYAPNGDYAGVSISLWNNQFVVQDGTTPTTPKQLQITDFVSQPTWAQPYAVQVTTVLRADVQPGDYVVLPQLPGVVQQGSKSQFYNVQPGNTYSTAKSGSIFTGTFLVTGVRHVGDSRSGLATAWVTTLDLTAYTGSASGSAPASLPVLYNPRRGTQYAFYLPQ